MSPPIRGYGFKLTDQDGYTRRGLPGETLWAPGVSRTTSGRGRLCGAGYTHFYSDPFTAAIFNQTHATIRDPRGWIVAYGGKVLDDRGRKMGASYVQVLREAPTLNPTVHQRIAFALLCALEVYQDVAWRTWAEEWLAGGDRSRNTAYTVWHAVSAAYSQPERYSPGAYATLAAVRDVHSTNHSLTAISGATSPAFPRLDLPTLAAWALTLGEGQQTRKQR